MSAIRMTKAQYLALIHRKPSKGYMARRKVKRVKDAAGYIADRKWSAEVKVRAGGKCEKCGSRKRLAAHHIFSRALKSVRHFPGNGVALCSGHHFFYAHKYPHIFRAWITQVRGRAWWDDLNLKAQTRHTRFTGVAGQVEEYGR